MRPCHETEAKRFRYSRGGMPKFLTKADRFCSSPPKPQSSGNGRKGQKDTRVVLYQETLQNAYKAYADYLDKKKEVGRMLKVIESIDQSELF